MSSFVVTKPKTFSHYENTTMNIEMIHRHLREIDKLIDVLDTKLSHHIETPEKIDILPDVVGIPSIQVDEPVQVLPQEINKTEVFSDTSITPRANANVNIDELRDISIPVIQPENIPVHMNGGGKISRDKQKSDDIYYTISILDLATK